MRLIALLFITKLVLAAAPSLDIKLDQVGYLSHAVKAAFLCSTRPGTRFVVRRAKDGAEAFHGSIGPAIADADSGDRVQTLDFSKLSKTGAYYLEVPGVGRSWDFEIGPNVYSRPWYLAMRSYYGQRCGAAVDLGPEFPGYGHKACHLDGAYHVSSGKTGAAISKNGWHDAGDYGRYVVNSGISTGTLLWTWELFGARIRHINLNLPESGNGAPDILNEIRWNLDWMLSMQDQDGGVWHKQTSERFCPFIMPEQDSLISNVIGTGEAPFKSSCATADFAAVMAIAGRAYKSFDAIYAERCLRAAQLAWTWIELHPDVIFKNPRGVTTGEYGDANCGDERLWAAAELWRTTHDHVYHGYFLRHYSEYRESIRPIGPQTWSNVANMALWTYAWSGGANPEANHAIRADSIKAADEIVSRTEAKGYRVSLTARDYIWGSNGVVANYAMQLVIADLFQPNRRYVEAALDDLHYLLGRNTFSLSFVTRLGANPVRRPHHRPSGADQNAEPWPGLLSGGPNRGRQDPVMRKLPADLPPAKMYIDDEQAYSANEVAINWNAPLVFVLASALRTY
jgi:endoglucanase